MAEIRINSEDSIFTLSKHILEKEVISIRVFTEDLDIISDIINNNPKWLGFIHFYIPATNKEINHDKFNHIKLTPGFNYDFYQVFDKCWEGNSHESIPIFYVSKRSEVYDKIKKVIENNSTLNKLNLFFGKDNTKFGKFVLGVVDVTDNTPFGFAIMKDDNTTYIDNVNNINNYILNPIEYARTNNIKRIYPFDNFSSKEEALYGIEQNQAEIYFKPFDFISDGDRRYKNAYKKLKETGFIFLTGFASGIDYVAKKLMRDLFEETNRTLLLKSYTAKNSIYNIKEDERFWKNKYQGLIFRNFFDPLIFIRNPKNDFFYDENVENAKNRSIFSVDDYDFSNPLSKLLEHLKNRKKFREGSYIIITSQYDKIDKLIESLNIIKDNYDEKKETIKNIIAFLNSISNSSYNFRGYTNKDDNKIWNKVMELKYYSDHFKDIADKKNITYYGNIKIDSGKEEKRKEQWNYFRKTFWYYLINNYLSRDGHEILSSESVIKIIDSYHSNIKEVYIKLNHKNSSDEK